MKRFLGVALLVFVGTAGWRVGSSLSPDALSMAIGVLFGVLAGVPTALLVMAGGRRSTPEETGSSRTRVSSMPPMGGYMPPQPPVIVVAGPPAVQPALTAGPTYGAPAYAAPEWGQAERQARRFKMVGEREEWLDEW